MNDVTGEHSKRLIATIIISATVDNVRAVIQRIAKWKSVGISTQQRYGEWQSSTSEKLTIIELLQHTPTPNPRGVWRVFISRQHDGQHRDKAYARIEAYEVQGGQIKVDFWDGLHAVGDSTPIGPAFVEFAQVAIAELQANR